jgi:hypothetical protein
LINEEMANSFTIVKFKSSVYHHSRQYGHGIWTILILCVSTFAGCRPDSQTASPPRSTQQSLATTPPASARIQFVERGNLVDASRYQNGEDSDYFAIIEALGGGVAAFDFDADGLWDLAFPGGGKLLPNNRFESRQTSLFRNGGGTTMFDLSSLMPPSNVYTHGAAAADYNEDGFPDLLITGYGSIQLLKNQGDGTFVDATSESNIDDRSWSTTAAWGDLNSDGIQDLYIAHYLDWSFENNPVCLERPSNRRDTCSPRSFKGLTDAAFLGIGDGTFRSAHDELGFKQGGKGLGVLLVDLDGDRDLDVYVANDGEANFVFQNVDGHFKDISVISGADRNEQGLPDGSMGLEAGDFNDDLLPDLWVTNFEKESMGLYRSSVQGFYQHVSQPMGITGIGTEYVGWGISLADFDGDGNEDVFIATGHANRFSPTSPRFQFPILLENQNGRRYANVASKAGEYFTTGHLGRGVARFDIDNNGRSDLAISHMLAPSTILENTTPLAGTWVGIRLIGRNRTRDPVGARVYTTSGDRRQTRFIKGGSSYLSTADPRLLFYFPKDVESASFTIEWPSGVDQQSLNLSVGRYHDIIEPPR